MAKAKTVLEKLAIKIEVMEKQREKILARKIEEIIKTDSEIIQLDKELDMYKKLKAKKEEQDKKTRELEEEITMFLEDGE